MSVLIEGINVILRRTVVEARVPGGIDSLADAAPDAARCADAHLIRFGFLDGEATDRFLEHLDYLGFRIDDGSQFLEGAVVDQVYGLPLPCDWLEFDSAPGEPAFCWLKGEPRGTLVVPENWRFEHSLSRRFGRVAGELDPERYRRVGQEGDLEIYEDLETGEQLFLTRTDLPPEPHP